jgi:hypothetical protein
MVSARTAALVFVLCGTTVRLARADDHAAAREAYDRGASAYDAGDYVRAARELRRAHDIVPNDVTLELAMKAASKADDPCLTMELVVRALRVGQSSSSSSLSATREEARDKMARRVGEVIIHCTDSATCSATFDDAPHPTETPACALVGEHRVVITTAGERQAFRVQVHPMATSEVTASSTTLAQPASVVTPRETRGGLSPAWFWLGIGVTTVLGGATIASGIDTQNRYDAFVSHPSAEGSTDGAAAERRTYWLTGGTVVSALASVALGAFFVRWSSSKPRPVNAKRW